MISAFRAFVWGIIPMLHFLIWLKIGRDAAPTTDCIKLGMISPFIQSDTNNFDPGSEYTAVLL